jgi:FtsH-binding integral membrane protein
VTAGPPQHEPGAAPPEREFPTLLEQMGGVQGVVASTIPVAVFVVANVLFALQPALIAALAAGVLIAVWRIVRKQPLQPAVSGLLGVGFAAFVAYRTGEARGFYLPGLIVSAAFGVAFLVSVLVRWPLAGVIWHGINGDGQSWRQDRRMLRAYTYASLLWTAVFAARVVVQGWLYNADEETWLGVARLAMGYPLVGVALLGTVWAVRRARREPAPAR